MAYLLRQNPAEKLAAANAQIEQLNAWQANGKALVELCENSTAMHGEPQHALIEVVGELSKLLEAVTTEHIPFAEGVKQWAQDAMRVGEVGVLDDVDVEAFEPAPLVVTVADFDEDTEAELAELLENHLHAKDINYSHALYELVNEVVNKGLEGPHLCVSYAVPAGGGLEEILNIEILVPGNLRATVATWIDTNDPSDFNSCSTGREVCEVLAEMLNATIQNARRGLGA